MYLLRSKLFWVSSAFVAFAGLIVSCTKHDQVLTTSTTTNTTELLSLKTTTPPTIDGTVDASWENAAKLNVLPAVPDPGNGLIYRIYRAAISRVPCVQCMIMTIFIFLLK